MYDAHRNTNHVLLVANAGEAPVGLPFVEHEDGSIATNEEAVQMRRFARSIFTHFNKTGVAPQKWGQLDVISADFYFNAMTERFPYLALCENNWKANMIATLSYPSWWRNHGSRAEAPGKNTKRDRSPSNASGGVQPPFKKSRPSPILSDTAAAPVNTGSLAPPQNVNSDVENAVKDVSQIVTPFHQSAKAIPVSTVPFTRDSSFQAAIPSPMPPPSFDLSEQREALSGEQAPTAANSSLDALNDKLLHTSLAPGPTAHGAETPLPASIVARQRGPESMVPVPLDSSILREATPEASPMFAPLPSSAISTPLGSVSTPTLDASPTSFFDYASPSNAAHVPGSIPCGSGTGSPLSLSVANQLGSTQDEAAMTLPLSILRDSFKLVMPSPMRTLSPSLDDSYEDAAPSSTSQRAETAPSLSLAVSSAVQAPSTVDSPRASSRDEPTSQAAAETLLSLRHEEPDAARLAPVSNARGDHLIDPIKPTDGDNFSALFDKNARRSIKSVRNPL